MKRVALGSQDKRPVPNWNGPFCEMAMSYWVYVLQSETSGLYYIGQTDDLSRRLARNNNNEFVCILCCLSPLFCLISNFVEQKTRQKYFLTLIKSLFISTTKTFPHKS
jgi:hypothetical protein